ncbi:MAG: hypothetical protein LDL26_04985 [Caenispirillum bisanense]|nr:hypothetical protein [Caenispirillum bisanense]MCA1972806.1 hypothetical protein [Caenispirillum sp.]
MAMAVAVMMGGAAQASEPAWLDIADGAGTCHAFASALVVADAAGGVLARDDAALVDQYRAKVENLPREVMGTFAAMVSVVAVLDQAPKFVRDRAYGEAAPTTADALLTTFADAEQNGRAAVLTLIRAGQLDGTRIASGLTACADTLQGMREAATGATRRFKEQ